MVPMTRARDFFEAVMDASVNAEKCNAQLAEHEAKASSLGSHGYGERVRSTPTHDRMGGRVASKVDHEAILERRMEGYYALIDRACVVLYGPDQMTGGLARDASPAWADALWHRYVAAEKWRTVADSMRCSPRQAQVLVSRALAWIDAHGYMAGVRELD